jgi:gamma-glutamylcyclotransferase (GGCT)/AIG2-like uncharacterized protein YtfP
VSALFVYGTLQLSDVMEAVTGRMFSSRAAHLEGYRCARLEGRTYPGIAPAAGARTPGRLYSGLDSDALGYLDAFEGSLYVREEVIVVSEGGVSALAFAYVLEPGSRALLTGDTWGLEAFRKRHGQEFLATYTGARRAR